jgi:putative tricarboxylic transport membrane protein
LGIIRKFSVEARPESQCNVCNNIPGSIDDLYIMFACGIIGYFMKKLDFPITPAVLGLVLGDRAEASLRRTLLLSLEDPSILVSRPISAILLALAAFSIVYPIFKKSKMFRES